MEIWRNRCPLFCCPVKGDIFCWFENYFIAKSQLICMGCPLSREHKQKNNLIFTLYIHIYIYILILVYPCSRVLDAFAKCGISENWTNQQDITFLWLWVSCLYNHHTHTHTHTHTHKTFTLCRLASSQVIFCTQLFKSLKTLPTEWPTLWSIAYHQQSAIYRINCAVQLETMAPGHQFFVIKKKQ